MTIVREAQRSTAQRLCSAFLSVLAFGWFLIAGGLLALPFCYDEGTGEIVRTRLVTKYELRLAGRAGLMRVAKPESLEYSLRILDARGGLVGFARTDWGPEDLRPEPVLFLPGFPQIVIRRSVYEYRSYAIMGTVSFIFAGAAWFARGRVLRIRARHPREA